MKYILSLDQGTTGTTAVLVDAQTFQFVGKVNKEYPQIYPKPSWVEHNLNDIWDTVETTVKEVLKKCNVTSSQIECIGITNQRETTCAFNKSGTPLANAIVWQDRRTSEYCQSLKPRQDWIQKKTGLPIDPYFSATKMRWLLQNNSQVQSAAKDKSLLFGNIDTFLLFKLTAALSHKTDASNASRTLLMNLETGNWDSELLNLFEIDSSFLPEICDSFHSFGTTKGLSFLPDGIPVTGILGDQQAALFGQIGFQPGDMKCTYGTGAFMLLNTGANIVYSNSGLLSTVAFRQNGKSTYALEGACYIAGAAVQWVRDNLKLVSKSSEIESLAQQVKSLEEMEHILLLPFFTGIGSPYWKADAKAAIVGLTRDSGPSHIARACLDGIALSINDLICAMRKDTSLSIGQLKVDGGAVENNLLMHIQSTISELKVIRPKVIETTAYGAALAAAIGVGRIGMSDMSKFWQMDKEFTPTQDELSFYQKKKTQWTSTIQKLY